MERRADDFILLLQLAVTRAEIIGPWVRDESMNARRGEKV
jgi:hypothetical protein